MHHWPVSYFRWRLKGKSIPGRSWGLSSTRHPKASVFPLCGSWTVTHTPNTGPTASASAQWSAVWCAQSSEKHSKPCLQPLLAQGRVWAWRVFWVWQPLKRHDNNVPWAGVIMYLAERRSSCCCDGSWMLPRVVLRCFGFVSHSLL